MDSEELERVLPLFSGPVLLQACASGPVLSFAGVAAEGRLRAFAFSRYERMWFPNGGSASFSVTVRPDPELVGRVERLVVAARVEGIFELEMIEHDAGYAAIDLNPRMYGSIALAVRAGANLPATWVEWLLGGNPEISEARPGVYYRWDDADLRYAWWHLRRGQRRAALEVFRPRRGVVHAYASVADPAPVVARAVELGKIAARRYRRTQSRDDPLIIGRAPPATADVTAANDGLPELRRNAPLILGYHAVRSDWESGLAMPLSVIEHQIMHFHRHGFVGLTFAQSEQLRASGRLPRRSLVITFDDAYASILDAEPLLTRYGYPATVFVVTSFPDSGRALSWFGIEDDGDASQRTPLGWSELSALGNAGWEVGSHTVNHPLLTLLDDDHLARELGESRAALEGRFGSCETIAYPYGVADGRVAAAAAAAGYIAGCTLTGVHLEDEPLRRPRLPVSRHDRGIRLTTKIAPPSLALRSSWVARAGRSLHRNRAWIPTTRDMTSSGVSTARSSRPNFVVTKVERHRRSAPLRRRRV